MNLLFWNLHRNELSNYIINVINEHDVDFAVFSEYDSLDLDKVRAELPGMKLIDNKNGSNRIISVCKKEFEIMHVRPQSRYVLYLFKYKENRYALAGIHLKDRRNGTKADRESTAREILIDLKDDVFKKGADNTIIIGDFNANPYDEEMLDVHGFHSVLFKDVIEKDEYRTHNGKEYKRLYNPVLNYISEDEKMYGSFYHTSGSNTSVWYCLDQVLVAKPLIHRISKMSYLKRIGKIDLCQSAGPNHEISDHLPLLIKFN